MPLASVVNILRLADSCNTSAIAFNTFDTNTIYAVARGAEAVKKPVIAMLYPTMREYMTFPAFAAEVRTLAEDVCVPVGLHLDHCPDKDVILDAIKAGFTSVMADGSMLPFEENVRFTRSIAEIAHDMGVEVEGELGIIGRIGEKGASVDYMSRDLYTTADEAQEYVERTGVDSLAIAIGSAHGFYRETPKLDLDRLREINARIATPLVLHGGSGIPEDQLVKAFKLGINKFNVGTEFIHLNMCLTRDAFAVEGMDKNSLDYIAFARKGLTEYISKKLELTTLTCE